MQVLVQYILVVLSFHHSYFHKYYLILISEEFNSMSQIKDKIKQSYLVNDKNRVTNDILEKRVQVCKQCNYFYEDFLQSVAMLVIVIIFILKDSKCPVKSKDWK